MSIEYFTDKNGTEKGRFCPPANEGVTSFKKAASFTENFYRGGIQFISITEEKLEDCRRQLNSILSAIPYLTGLYDEELESLETLRDALNEWHKNQTEDK